MKLSPRFTINGKVMENFVLDMQAQNLFSPSKSKIECLELEERNCSIIGRMLCLIRILMVYFIIVKVD